MDDGAPITVNGHLQGTYPGTYLRLELAPGRHRIAGFAGDAGWIDVDAVPGEIRFVQQAVIRSFIGPAQSRFRFVDPHYGRNAALRYELVGAH